MPDISEYFSPERGDLLYGLAAARGEYLAHMEAQRPRALDGFVTMVDDYNTMFYDSVWKTPGQPYNAHVINQELLTSKAAIKQNTPESEDVADDFYGKITASRFSPLSVGNASAQKASREGFGPATKRKGSVRAYHNDDGYTLDALNRSFLAVRRGCKFGIGFVADKVSTSRPQSLIHFALDGMQMQSILDKDTFELNLGNTAVPITTSELRYTFRNWSRFDGRVRFYVNYVNVPAPWEADWTKTDLWGADIEAKKSGWDGYRKVYKAKPQSAVKYAPGHGATV